MRSLESGIMVRRLCSGLLAVTLAACAFTLAGCAGSGSPSTATSTANSHSATTSSARFYPNGNAQQNLPFFNAVNEETVAKNPNASGRDFINGLVAAGFDKSDMQVTADITTVGLTPGSVQFSIKMGNSCLIGQNGNGSDGYHGEAVAALATGTCLIGETVPITW